MRKLDKNESIISFATIKYFTIISSAIKFIKSLKCRRNGRRERKEKKKQKQCNKSNVKIKRQKKESSFIVKHRWLEHPLRTHIFKIRILSSKQSTFH